MNITYLYELGLTINAFEQIYEYVNSIGLYEVKPIVNLYKDSIKWVGGLLDQIDQESLYMYGYID